MSNLKLWESVEKTNTQYVKTETIKKRTVTSIAPQYQLKTATKAFGPYGIGFGVDSVVVTYKKIGDTELLMYDAEMFYEIDGRKGRLPISAVQQMAYITNMGKGYLLIDEDAQRKAETNAMSKGLSRLGFNADVFMGDFDDRDYVENLKINENIENAEDKEKEIDIQKKALKAYMEEAISNINIKENGLPAIKGIHKKSSLYLQKRSTLPDLKDSAEYALKQVHKAYETRIKGFEND